MFISQGWILKKTDSNVRTGSGKTSPPTNELVPRGSESTKADRLLASVPGVTPLPPEPEHCAPPSNRPLNLPVNHTDVFVDDFIQLGQGGQRRLNSQRDHLLHAIDEVLDRPLPGWTSRYRPFHLSSMAGLSNRRGRLLCRTSHTTSMTHAAH